MRALPSSRKYTWTGVRPSATDPSTPLLSSPRGRASTRGHQGRVEETARVRCSRNRRCRDQVKVPGLLDRDACASAVLGRDWDEKRRDEEERPAGSPWSIAEHARFSGAQRSSAKRMAWRAVSWNRTTKVAGAASEHKEMQIVYYISFVYIYIYIVRYIT